MSDTTPKPDAPEDAVIAQAVARANEVLDRIELRRMEILDRRRAAIDKTERIANADVLHKAVGTKFEPRLKEITKAAGERLARVDTARKEFADAVKKVRSGLAPPKKRRRAVRSG
jgi:DNA-binding TFAR19-related protein (PDSD5 family)